MQIWRYVPPWLSHLLTCMGGCLGCYPNRDLIIGTDEALKHLKNQGQSGKNLSVSEDFWSTSTCEMENSAALSQRSMSSTATSFQVLDPQGCPVGSSRPSEFINYGLLVWNQTRQQWIGNKRSQSHKHVRGPRRSWNATYENLLATNRPFPQPIPLSEMVDFLVDVWEQEGLYDWA